MANIFNNQRRVGIVSSAEPAGIIINSGSTNLSTDSINNQPSVIRKLSPSEALEKGLASSTRGTIESGKPQQPLGRSKLPGISTSIRASYPASSLANWDGIPCPPGTIPGKVVQQAFFTDEYGDWYEFLWFDCVPIGQGGSTGGGGTGGTDNYPGGNLEGEAGRGTNLGGTGGGGGGISTSGSGGEGYGGSGGSSGGGSTVAEDVDWTRNPFQPTPEVNIGWRRTAAGGGGVGFSGTGKSNRVPLHGIDGGRGLGIVQDGRRPRIGIIRNFADTVYAGNEGLGGEFVDYKLPEEGEEEKEIIVNFKDDEGTEECSPEFKELVKKVIQNIYDNLIPCLEKYGGALVELAKKMRESIDTKGVNIACDKRQNCDKYSGALTSPESQRIYFCVDSVSEDLLTDLLFHELIHYSDADASELDAYLAVILCSNRTKNATLSSLDEAMLGTAVYCQWCSIFVTDRERLSALSDDDEDGIKTYTTFGGRYFTINIETGDVFINSSRFNGETFEDSPFLKNDNGTYSIKGTYIPSMPKLVSKDSKEFKDWFAVPGLNDYCNVWCRKIE